MDLLNWANECGPASGSGYDGEPTVLNYIVANIYEVASNLAHQELYRRQQTTEAS